MLPFTFFRLREKEASEWNGDSHVRLSAVVYVLCVRFCVHNVGRHQHLDLEEHVSHQPLGSLGYVTHDARRQG